MGMVIVYSMYTVPCKTQNIRKNSLLYNKLQNYRESEKAHSMKTVN